MHMKYNFNLLLIQMAMIFILINSVTANLLDKLTEMTLTVNKEEASKQEKADILSMGQYFQDIFSEHLAPLKLEFGHVCENPIEWEQRFERKDFDNNRYSGKVKWGNKNGEYGEQYWDLNH
ncbi:PREDICTED: uncharacterized protein LOC105454085 isoform X2 [Wasmannia auropunctata]|uniref:uncharacterized protein LOC105454085 isoform X2 n=1 Tax=Wasmannia auropunctata TaxID=64793 RepID=UPI0005EE06A4|nr:PREDICTED: uncharacterized protein LOC105454085 isoform X2 [Wasmannia auropunctata]